ncbi:MAG: cytochrome c, partial [candidate division Zixibacteria bacterium]|nr:cytochrome c [candidate division Zixibacteria bacterium]
GCYQGKPSEKPPIHLNPDMDYQPKYQPQEYSAFFENGAAMRTPPLGTIPRDWLRDDNVFYRGVNDKGRPVKNAPLEMNMLNLKRGRVEFNVYCSPCHGRTGDGKGIMLQYGYVPPPSFHTDRIRDLHDGEIFDVISNGIRNMPSYRNQVQVEDRWKIILYLRALERSQNASIEDVPEEMRDKIK